MSNRIDQRFAALKKEGKSAFIAYVCAGDPDLERSLEIIRAIDRAGADVLELGLPFSDPLADGIVNQMAADRALKAGTTTRKVLDLVRKIREESETPIVLYTYLNNTYAYGYEAFQADAVAAGVDGILNLDLPPDEALVNQELAAGKGMRQIRLIAPTTPPERLKMITKHAEGFVYYVSQEGVTGARSEIATNIGENVELIRRAAGGVPVAVGFGISTPEQAAAVAGMSDGVVVGSAIVRTIADHLDAEDLAERVYDVVKPLVDATKSV